MLFVGGLGMGEIIMILVILLLVFGAKRLPELGGALGKGIREFKRSVHEIESEFNRPDAPPRREVSSGEQRGNEEAAAARDESPTRSDV